jgi:enoyl-CoA hydratase/carnithine racemase
MPDSPEDILITRNATILEIAFNRVPKKNALTDAMYRQIADQLEAAADDEGIRAVLFRGEGGVFTSGNDIHDFSLIATGQRDAKDMQVMRLLRILAHYEKPVIAAVEGLAVGIGLTLLLHCDLVYVAKDARLSVPFVDLALVPEAASSLLLPQIIGPRRAYAMFACGAVMEGAEAAELGLANEALDAAHVLVTAREKAHMLSQKAPGALALTKRLMRDGALFAERLVSPEAREAFMAFAQKRRPDFSQF